MRIDIFNIEWYTDDEDSPIEIYGWNMELSEFEQHYSSGQVGSLIAESITHHNADGVLIIPSSFTWVNLRTGKRSVYPSKHTSVNNAPENAHNLFEGPQIHFGT